jgi:hypothetical protein
METTREYHKHAESKKVSDGKRKSHQAKGACAEQQIARIDGPGDSLDNFGHSKTPA